MIKPWIKRVDKTDVRHCALKNELFFRNLTWKPAAQMKTAKIIWILNLININFCSIPKF